MPSRVGMAHIFVVNSDTLPLHLQRGFAGVVKAGGTGWYGQLADIMNVRVGDLVFFYCSYTDKKKLFWPGNVELGVRPGYWGIYRIAAPPFEDTSDIVGLGPFQGQYIFGTADSKEFKALAKSKQQNGVEFGAPKILPIRIPIEPISGQQYGIPVDDTTAYVDRTDAGQLWTLFFKKISKQGQARAITPLLPEEADKIARLLYRDNELIRRPDLKPIDIHMLPYPNKPRTTIRLAYSDLIHPEFEGLVRNENILVAWLMTHLDQGLPVLRDLCEPVEDLEFVGSHVQYGINGESVDVLLLHRKRVSSTCSYRYRATVIEVKRGNITPTAVSQIARYVKWIAQLTTFNNISVLQPIIIGRDISPASESGIRREVDRLEAQGVRRPWFVGYHATPSGISLRWLTEPRPLDRRLGLEGFQGIVN